MRHYLPSARSKQNAVSARESVFDSLFNELYSLPSSLLSNNGVELSPRIDISETDNEYKIEAELPGMSQKEIEIKIDENMLNISGKKEEMKEEEVKNYHLRERYYGNFHRLITLPNNIDADKIYAGFENGVLNIVVPKSEKKNSKKIEIK